jgi:phosphoribosylformylglycinamidine synthase I
MAQTQRCAVLVFPGSNCDSDLLKAAQAIPGWNAEYVWHTTESLEGFDLILVPGGFSYGDYLRVGAMAARSPVMQALRKEATNGVTVLGICNGFQILTEAGLLPGTLLPNRSLKFVCEVSPLEVANAQTAFSSRYTPGATIRVPVAHGAGNYFCDAQTLEHLEANGQVVFRYAEGQNPNGSLNNIAGICNASGNVLGMMPHPERAMAEWMGSADGRALFESLQDALN